MASSPYADFMDKVGASLVLCGLEQTYRNDFIGGNPVF